MALTLKELADAIGAELVGQPNVVIDSAGTLEDARAGQVSFLSNPKYAKQLETTHASAAVVSMGVKTDRLALLRTKDPYYAFTQAVVLLHGHRKHPHAGIHPRAHIEPTATIGEGTVIYPGVYVGPRVRIGRDCVLYPNVVIYEDCVLGDRVAIHANSSIGQDGFGYAPHQGIHHKIPQIGNVIIEDDVEIGANTCIDRAALGSTLVSKGSKINDLVAIGHGTRIGPHCLIVAQCGIAGSVTLGHHVTMAGQVGVAGHLRIGDNVTIGAQAGITNSVPDQSTVLGSPAMPISQARRVAAVFVQLPELNARVKKLEQHVEELGTKEDTNSETPNE
ncbi:MAG TPA: UDP-3-O-(3-hydroxymyristoyl)glucosamine N-acyltransferase [Tepidisphaeraceae bacterium]|nr:UDP-3-O-(3-hydroxymyristoyl)glucosamine N-acyltransferase [Tepidisphaeraceae bacterium]